MRPSLRAFIATFTVVSGLLLALPSSGPPQQSSNPKACDAVEGSRQLDFWVGDWEVFDADGGTTWRIPWVDLYVRTTEREH